MTKRTSLLIAPAFILALAACDKQADDGAAATNDSDVTIADYEVNDVTAIDAVTGDAANMAAEMDYNLANVVEEDGNALAAGNAAAPAPRLTPSRPAPRPSPKQAPAPEPAEPAAEGNTAG